MPPEKCYLPKKQIHVWSGHTKVGSFGVYLIKMHFVLYLNFYKTEASVKEMNVFSRLWHCAHSWQHFTSKTVISIFKKQKLIKSVHSLMSSLLNREVYFGISIYRTMHLACMSVQPLLWNLVKEQVLSADCYWLTSWLTLVMDLFFPLCFAIVLKWLLKHRARCKLQANARVRVQVIICVQLV